MTGPGFTIISAIEVFSQSTYFFVRFTSMFIEDTTLNSILPIRTSYTSNSGI